MRLYESFKEVVEKRGGDIVRHKAFLNLLNDMNAFGDEDKTVFKKIMREMYKDDLPERIVGEGKWNGICQHHIDNFVKTNGCQQHIVEYIVKCLVYSIGWISESEMARAYNDYAFGEQKPKNTTKTVHKPTTKQTTHQSETTVQPTRQTTHQSETTIQPTRQTTHQPEPPLPTDSTSSNSNSSTQSWLSKNAAWFIPCIILLLLAVVVASQMTSKSKTGKNVKAKETEMLASDTVFNLTREDLAGNYSVKIESNGQLKRLTGYIDYDAIGQCTLHVLSDYEPMLFILNVNGKGVISNDDLGTTYMIHQKSINKRTITFTKNNTVCTLTR